MIQSLYRMVIFAGLLVSLTALAYAASPTTSKSQTGTQDETGLVLITNSEADQLRVTDADLLIPVSTPMMSDGPRIVLRRPTLTGTGRKPKVITSSPTNLTVVFEENQSPINMASLEVKARKGIFKKSLTKRLKPYIQGTSIVAQGVKMPAGKFIIEIEIADQTGARTSKRYYLTVN